MTLLEKEKCLFRRLNMDYLMEDFDIKDIFSFKKTPFLKSGKIKSCIAIQILDDQDSYLMNEWGAIQLFRKWDQARRVAEIIFKKKGVQLRIISFDLEQCKGELGMEVTSQCISKNPECDPRVKHFYQ
jgi:hypothetical protein